MLADGISKVSINSKVKICKKNIELTIDKCMQAINDYDPLQLTKETRNNYVVQNDGLHYLFSRSGVVPLSNGMSISLTPEREIRHYIFGYLDGLIIPQKISTLSGECLLRDILAHYKRTETFIWNDFDTLELSQTAFHYIENCEKSGKINSAAKHFIEEGRI